MFLTVHSATGLLIDQYVKSPLLAFGAGFISHYIFDIIPHGDTRIPKQYHNIIHITLAGIFDLAIMSGYLLLVILGTNQFLTLSQIFAIIGSILPDALQLIYFIYSDNKYLRKICKWHHYFHNLVSRKFQINLTAGIILQLILFIILLNIIY